MGTTLNARGRSCGVTAHDAAAGSLGTRMALALALATLVAGIAGTAGSFGCGPSKPAEDPSKETSASKEEETPKWDATSETASGAGSSSHAGESAGGSSEGAPPAHKGFSPAPESTSRKMDVYDKDQTEVVLKRAARQVKDNCGLATDDEGKRVGPWGKTQVSIVLGHNGHSKGATIPAPYEGKPAGRCAVQAFSNLTFPPWSGPDTTVQWDVEIIQPK